MPKARGKYSDQYMNFVPIELDLSAGDTSALQEQRLATSITPRSDLMWELHLIEVWGVRLTTNFLYFDWALSYQGGEAAMPELGDTGCIARGRNEWQYATSGGGIYYWPQRLTYFPPIAFAHPGLSFYVQGSANHNDGKGTYTCRIGMTTEPLAGEDWREVAETWAFGVKAS